MNQRKSISDDVRELKSSQLNLNTTQKPIANHVPTQVIGNHTAPRVTHVISQTQPLSQSQPLSESQPISKSQPLSQPQQPQTPQPQNTFANTAPQPAPRKLSQVNGTVRLK